MTGIRIGSTGGGGSPAASYVTTAAEATLSGETTLGALIGRGVLASRPAFGTAGRLYYATDTRALSRDTGSAWEDVSDLVAHNLFSATHPDVDAADTPADTEVLTYNAVAGKWQAAPAPGAGTGAATTLSYVTTASEASLSNEKVLGSAVIMRGVLASRPAAATAGLLYANSDAGNQEINRDTGSAWEAIALRMQGAHVTRSTTQSIPNATTTAVDFATEDRDDGTFWAVSPNPSRITVPVAGWYLFGGTVTWASSTAGSRIIELRVNGATYLAAHGVAAATIGAVRGSVIHLYYLAAADYVEMTVYQDSGGALNVASARLWLARLG